MALIIKQPPQLLATICLNALPSQSIVAFVAFLLLDSNRTTSQVLLEGYIRRQEMQTPVSQTTCAIHKLTAIMQTQIGYGC